MLMCNKSGFFSLDEYETKSLSPTGVDESDDDDFPTCSLSIAAVEIKTTLSDAVLTYTKGDEIKSLDLDCSEPSSTSQSLLDAQVFNVNGEMVHVRHYKVIKPLVEGSSSMVFIVESNEKGENRYSAMKIISKDADEHNASLFQTEIKHLLSLSDIPGVIKLKDHFSDNNCCYMITELASYDLSNMESKSVNARWVVRSLLETVSQLHERKIAHRDIKPENVVIMESLEKREGSESDGESESEVDEEKARKVGTKSKHLMAKLIDFGSAIWIDSESDCKYKDLVGTVSYLSPEKFEYHESWHEWSGDVWSIGVVAYELVFDRRLFEWNLKIDTLKKLITQGSWSFPENKPEHFSNVEWLLFRHFVIHLLAVNPQQRTTASYALRHPWLDIFTFSDLTEQQARLKLGLWESCITSYGL